MKQRERIHKLREQSGRQQYGVERLHQREVQRAAKKRKREAEVNQKTHPPAKKIRCNDYSVPNDSVVIKSKNPTHKPYAARHGGGCKENVIPIQQDVSFNRGPEHYGIAINQDSVESDWEGFKSSDVESESGEDDMPLTFSNILSQPNLGDYKRPLQVHRTQTNLSDCTSRKIEVVLTEFIGFYAGQSSSIHYFCTKNPEVLERDFRHFQESARVALLTNEVELAQRLAHRCELLRSCSLLTRKDGLRYLSRLIGDRKEREVIDKRAHVLLDNLRSRIIDDYDSTVTSGSLTERSSRSFTLLPPTASLAPLGIAYHADSILKHETLPQQRARLWREESRQELSSALKKYGFEGVLAMQQGVVEKRQERDQERVLVTAKKNIDKGNAESASIIVTDQVRSYSPSDRMEETRKASIPEDGQRKKGEEEKQEDLGNKIVAERADMPPVILLSEDTTAAESRTEPVVQYLNSSGNNQYGEIQLQGQASAILGNNYGTIQQAHFCVAANSSRTSSINTRYATRVDRRNEILTAYTLETITTFQEGGPLCSRGTSSQISIRWHKAENIGAGVFGEVHRETQDEDLYSPQSRAIKVLRRRQLKRLNIEYKRELGAMMRLARADYSHNFVEFYAWYESVESIYIAMEYVPGGDLSRYITNGLSPIDADKISYQVLDGLRVLHSLDIVHRDIKPANVFVVKSSPEWHVKIGDFGICKNTVTQQTSLHTRVGTDGYQAPEVLGLVKHGNKTEYYDSKCDIWSFACLYHELSFGYLLFPHLMALINFCNKKSSSYDKVIAQYLEDGHREARHSFVKRYLLVLLEPDPQKRPTAAEAFARLERLLGIDLPGNDEALTDFRPNHLSGNAI